ncbi:Iron ascorbate family oxidoreductase [Olea europaea subsp. europaea]|uniref:Iron ascorbate family oxidoreductase n=1 Tax=Olea europaea subsp. europaea TaxID=158383 RepID=A0A8S0RJK3_OLEEU|nr:Iron ascorbate family oxidoreductase [Olea europaea subsp. europaea]
MASHLPQPSVEPSNINSCVKILAESADLKSVPSKFSFIHDPTCSNSDSIPIIDFSLLISSNPDQRSKVIQELGKACNEWGFFVLVNHGIPETLVKAIVDRCTEFFDLPEEKRKYETSSGPVKHSTGSILNSSKEGIFQWRDFIHTVVHPEYHFPDKPQNLREILYEYAENSRSVSKKLLQLLSTTMGLEEGFIDETRNLNSSFQIFAANCYPPCPQPDKTIGTLPHTDPRLLTFLIHNGVAGLQIEHNGKWFSTNSPQNSILVNVADQLEIFSNGKYKSVKHRAVVNEQTTRLSIVLFNGPASDAIVSPASKLIQRDGRPLYRPMKCIEYMKIRQKDRVVGYSSLDCVKILDN